MPVYTFEGKNKDGETVRFDDLVPSGTETVTDADGCVYKRLPSASPIASWSLEMSNSGLWEMTSSAMHKPAPHLYGENITPMQYAEKTGARVNRR